MLGKMATGVRPAWTIHRQQGSQIPPDTEAARRYLRRGNLAEALLGGGSDPALVAGDLALSNDELRAAAGQAASRLEQAGVTQGTHVGMFAENSGAWIISYLGLQLLGATVVGMNPAFKAAEAEQILTDSEAAMVLVDSGRQALIDTLRPRLAALRTTARVEEIGSADPHPLASSTTSLGPDSPALLLYTSGTTGRPKGALLDHGNLLAQARGVVEAWRWTAADRLVLALPLFHVHGLAIALNGSLVAGGCAVLVPFSPENVIRELQAGGTMFFCVPGMYQRLPHYLEKNPADLRHARLFVARSAPLPATPLVRCQRLLGQPVLERYGITEGGIVVSNPYDGPRQPGRVGYPLPGVDVRLGDQDEVQLKGGQVFKGYWRNHAASTDVFVDGWFRTGDIGEIAADGSLAIRGRIKELIISGGDHVYPREVQMVLAQPPAVTEGAGAGSPPGPWWQRGQPIIVCPHSG